MSWPAPVLAAVLAADYQAGFDAYDRGDYAAAWAEWQPLAEQGNANAQYHLGVMPKHTAGASRASKWANRRCYVVPQGAARGGRFQLRKEAA